jgi:hypothetical protein
MPSILFSAQIWLSHILLLFDLIYAQLSVGFMGDKVAFGQVII